MTKELSHKLNSLFEGIKQTDERCLKNIANFFTFEKEKRTLQPMKKKDNHKNPVPTFSPNLFWDVNIEDLDAEQHKSFIVNRVLDYGQWNDWKTILDYYGLDQIVSIAQNLRSLFPKSLAFISTVSHIPEDQFRCYAPLQSKDKLWHF